MTAGYDSASTTPTPSQEQLSDDDFAVLNAVHLRKIATVAAVSDISGLTAGELSALVPRAVAAGRIEDLGGMLAATDRGVADLLAEYARRYGELRADPEVLGFYERFEVVNKQFLVAISAWQTDPDDGGRLDRVLRLAERHEKALRGIAPRVPRYSRYADRLQAAADRAAGGQADYLTSPNVDSVHNIWFEFHEDVLTLIGRPRDVAEAT